MKQKRKIFSKCTAILLLAVILLSMLPAVPVSAASVTDNKTITLKYAKPNLSYQNGWSRTAVKMKANEKTVYCVQPEKTAPPAKSYDSGQLKQVPEDGKLGNKDKKAFNKALYYCYGGTWFEKKVSAWGNKSMKDLMDGYKDINPPSEKYYLITHILLSYMYGGEKTSYGDYLTNYVPQSYITAAKEIYNKLTKVPAAPVQLRLYYLDTGSDYQIVLMQKPQEKLKIVKQSDNTSVKYTNLSAEFTVYTDAKCTKKYGTIKTDSAGVGTYGNWADVPFQSYYAKETKAPVGFKKSSEIYQFKPTEDVRNGSAVYQITVKNTPLVHLQLLKSSANPDITDGNSCYSLKGAKYNIYTDKACTKYYGYITTDADGYGRYGDGTATNTNTKDKSTSAYKKVSGKNIELSNGVKFYAQEDKTVLPKGYDWDSTVYEFKDCGSTSSDGIRILRAYDAYGKEPTDKPIDDPIGIVLQKRNSITGETVNQGLGGAVFEIQYYAQEIDKDYDVDTSKGEVAPALNEANLKCTWYIKTNEKGRALLNPSYIADNYSSDDYYYNNGLITLPIGTTVIKEVEAPSGYTINNTVFYRRINEEIASLAQDTNTPIEIPIDEQPAVGYIGIHKMNNSRHGVANAVYGLYADETATELVSQLTTDADGKGIFDCKAAVNKTYYIKEISAPPGYSLDTTIYPVTATTANSTVDTAVIQDIYEDSIKGDIIIKKSSNDGIVSNICFALSDNLGNEYQAVSTNHNGTAKYTGLPVYDSDGNKINYTVKELGFKTTPGKKSYGSFTWTVKAIDCIKYKGLYYEGVANDTFSDCEYAYSRYYYGNKNEAMQNSNGYTQTLTENSAVTFNFNNTVKATDIEVNKQSYDGRKDGVWFKIVDQTGKSYGEIVTDADGSAVYSKHYSKPLYSCITVPNSAISLRIKYRIEELGFKNPGSNTYYLPDTYINNVVSDYKSDNLSVSDNVINFEVYNKPDVGRIEINKSSDDDVTADICFKISAYEDDTEYSGEMYDAAMGYDENGNELHSIIVKTDKDGKASSDSIQLYDCNGNAMNGLPVYLFGENDYEITYEITELGFDNGDGTYTLPKRYIPNEPFRSTLLENRFITYDCVNIIKKGQLQIKKTSEDDIVDNFCFNVKSLNINDIDIIVKTDADGITDIIDDLPIYVPSIKNDILAEYEITELGRIGENGYEIPPRYNTPAPVKITLNENSEITFTAFHNQLKKGSVTLYKQDYNGKALSGSEWELYKSDDSPVTMLQNGNGSYFASDKGKVKTLLTDSKGKLVVSNLAQGDYYFIETKSPNGTSAYGKKINFTISAESSSTLSPILTVKNNKIVMFNTGGNGNSKIYIAGLMLAMSFAIISAYILKAKKQHNSK